MSENYGLIQKLAAEDAAVLEIKGQTYGDSWKKRGGVGAFMMLSRKWDRIENICEGIHWNIFEAGVMDTGGILDDIADLRRYLLLVEAEVREQRTNNSKGAAQSNALNTVGAAASTGAMTGCGVKHPDDRAKRVEPMPDPYGRSV